MAKIKRGRISGVEGMESYSVADLHAWANTLEAKITDPKNSDDPRYLRRWAKKIRVLATQKEKALDHKKKSLQHTVRRLTRRCT